MDLTKEYPRSPYAKMAGIVSLPRMLDKAHAAAEGKLGEYDVDCPHDKPVLQFMGIDFPTFAEKIKQLDYDDSSIELWARGLLANRSAGEIEAFNESRLAWAPDEHSAPYFNGLRDQIAPGRTDVTTWFKLLDIDEHRA
jgi:hypothetical protein